MDDNLRELERLAASGDPQAEERYRQARIRAGLLPPEMPEGGLWVNAYQNNQAKATLHVTTYEEVCNAERFLHHFFTETPMRVGPRSVYDLQLSQRVTVPAEQVRIITELTPSFDLEEGRPYPRPPIVEPYVALRLVEDFSELRRRPPPPPMIDDVELYWLNVYEVTRRYGGPAEGGDWYNYHMPIAILNVSRVTVRQSSERDLPAHLHEAEQFLHQLYDGRAHGDIYSSRGGVEIHINFEESPGQYPNPYSYE